MYEYYTALHQVLLQGVWNTSYPSIILAPLMVWNIVTRTSDSSALVPYHSTLVRTRITRIIATRTALVPYHSTLARTRITRITRIVCIRVQDNSMLLRNNMTRTSDSYSTRTVPLDTRTYSYDSYHVHTSCFCTKGIYSEIRPIFDEIILQKWCFLRIVLSPCWLSTPV